MKRQPVEVRNFFLKLHEGRCFLGVFHDILKLPFLRVQFFEPVGNFRDGFQEAQKETALYRVIHVLR